MTIFYTVLAFGVKASLIYGIVYEKPKCGPNMTYSIPNTLHDVFAASILFIIRDLYII